MLNFNIDRQKCTGCGTCAADCPAGIISLEGGTPSIPADREKGCYRCQHCLAVCPAAAVSIFGCRPEQSLPLPGHLPDPVATETLIRGRRAVRRYREENLEPEFLRRLLDVACHAPSGMNARQCRFTVIDDRAKMVALRDELMARLSGMAQSGGFPAGLEFFQFFLAQWEEKRVDFLFRGAPHLLVVSAPQEIATPTPDCLIALTNFELYANSVGIGTVWDGLATLAINDLFPELRGRLGIPANHVIGYAMAFGRPAVQYARTTQHAPAEVHFV
ncbi:nitroreductase family protein [Geomesophilobacter sediminis]|uniref:Nitroreductase family protein n=1 Tax=Geomesophilobacter sediminis TaxID=2798584 RepID=A0A8J7M1D5_9BACT|nr:nitroreductase family protein [Geomesophilobacter sediminis]MBJ6726856.1 nitroreductase family protein [Geomesophilobacter sediminis]